MGFLVLPSSPRIDSCASLSRTILSVDGLPWSSQHSRGHISSRERADLSVAVFDKAANRKKNGGSSLNNVINCQKKMLL